MHNLPLTSYLRWLALFSRKINGKEWMFYNSCLQAKNATIFRQREKKRNGAPRPSLAVCKPRGLASEGGRCRGFSKALSAHGLASAAPPGLRASPRRSRWGDVSAVRGEGGASSRSCMGKTRRGDRMSDFFPPTQASE